MMSGIPQIVLGGLMAALPLSAQAAKADDEPVKQESVWLQKGVFVRTGACWNGKDDSEECGCVVADEFDPVEHLSKASPEALQDAGCLWLVNLSYPVIHSKTYPHAAAMLTEKLKSYVSAFVKPSRKVTECNEPSYAFGSGICGNDLRTQKVEFEVYPASEKAVSVLARYWLQRIRGYETLTVFNYSLVHNKPYLLRDIIGDKTAQINRYIDEHLAAPMSDRSVQEKVDYIADGHCKNCAVYFRDGAFHVRFGYPASRDYELNGDPDGGKAEIALPAELVNKDILNEFAGTH